MRHLIKFTVIGIDHIQSMLNAWRQFLLPFYEQFEQYEEFNNKYNINKKEIQKIKKVKTPITKNTHKIESDKIFDKEFKRTLKDFLRKNKKE